MHGAIPKLTYVWLRYLLLQLIYARTKSAQKDLLLSREAWNMLVLFSICFYQININMTNDCVSITKTLVKGVKLTTDRYKKNAHIKSKGRKKNSYIFLHNNDYETPYLDIYIDLLSIIFNLMSVL